MKRALLSILVETVHLSFWFLGISPLSRFSVDLYLGVEAPMNVQVEPVMAAHRGLRRVQGLWFRVWGGSLNPKP